MTSLMPSAADAALVVCHLFDEAAKARGKDVTRARLSAKTLRRVTFRTRLRDAFLDELEDALVELGWIMVQVDDHYGFIRRDAVGGWPRFSSERIKATLTRIRREGRAVFSELAATTSDGDGDGADEEEDGDS